MKYLLTFEKSEGARWLGHLDVMRTFERAIRRSRVPVAFSEGFNPRVRLSFASALGVGVTGGHEKATIELTESLPPDTIARSLNQALPPGFHIGEVDAIPDTGFRDLLNSYNRAKMRITCTLDAAVNREQVSALPEEVMRRSSIIYRRERDRVLKDVDVRQFILSLSLDRIEGDEAVFTMILAVGQEGSIRPQEISTLLVEHCSDLTVRSIHRERLIRSDNTDEVG